MLGGVAVVAFRCLGLMVETASWVEHTHTVLTSIEELRTVVSSAENIRRGYALTGDEGYVPKLETASEAARTQMRLLRELTSDNPARTRDLDELEPLLTVRLATLKGAMDERRNRGLDAKNEVLVTTKGAAANLILRDLLVRMRGEEERLRILRQEQARTDARNTRIVVGVGVAVASALLILVFRRLKKEIAERAKIEAELRVAKEAGDAANRELEAFSYSVAHDLRAPLRGINGFAQVLVEDYAGKLDAGALDCLTRITAASTRMGECIDALLALSRVTRTNPARQLVDLSQVASAVIGQLQAGDPARSVEVQIEAGLAAEADPQLVRALFDNLLGNAWKFTSKCPHAVIGFGSAEKDGARVFQVTDNGAGFDMAYATKLFAPFQRLHGNAEFAGTGIGLATVKRIVHRHGGRIWAEGTVDHGAVFSFTLPKRKHGGLS